MTIWQPLLFSFSLKLSGHTESPLWSPPQSPDADIPANQLPRHGVRVESTGEWRMVYKPAARDTISDSNTHEIDKSGEPGQDETKTDEKAGKAAREGTSEVVWQVVVRSDWVADIGEGLLKMESIEMQVEDWHDSSDPRARQIVPGGAPDGMDVDGPEKGGDQPEDAAKRGQAGESIGQWGIPDRVVRALEISQQMEDLVEGGAFDGIEA
jgi:hypothetical protein